VKNEKDTHLLLSSRRKEDRRASRTRVLKHHCGVAKLSGSRHQFRNNNNNSKNSMRKSGGAAFPVFLLTSAAIAVSYFTYLQFKKKDSRGNDDDEEENGWSPTENNAQPLLTSDIDVFNAATPQIKPIKQPHDANIDVLDLTPKSANTTQKDTAAAATDATINSITESSTPTKEEKKEKKACDGIRFGEVLHSTFMLFLDN
jgi:hypothetical protein